MSLLGIGVFFAALLFSLGEMGFLTRSINLLIAFTLAVIFLSIHLPRRWGRVGAVRLIAGGVLLVAAALLGQGSDLLRLLGFAALAAAVLTVLEKDDPRRPEVGVLLPAVFLFSVFYLAHRHVPHLWWLSNAAALEFSRAVGRVIGQDYAMSATASGFRVAGLAACWGVGRFVWVKPRRWSDLGILVLLLVAVSAVVQMLLTPLALIVQHWAGRLDFLLFNWQVLYLAALLVPIAWYRRRGPVDDPARAWRLAPLAHPVALVAGAVLAFALTLAPRGGPGSGRVLIYDEGFLNWEVPVFGRYGERSGGMFGRLPGFIDAQGYEAVKVPKPLTPEALSDARVLILINVMEFFDAAEKQAIWDFVAGGGSLLVLGDHTGVKGIRGPFNDLLEPVAIEFEFDSATFWAQGWRDALELLPHPINRDILVSEDIQIWVGASLGFSPPGRPVIVGKYGYSDIGDAANLDRSYLGDRRHNPGEQMGDICLAAEAPYGRGRVLVFGDTSPFQNGALVTSWGFVQRTLQWLTDPPSSSRIHLKILALAVAVVLALLARRGLRVSPYAWGTLALGLVLGFQATDRLAEPPPVPKIDLPKALVDLSHGERFDQLTWYDDCVGGLELNLARNGYCPMLMRAFSDRLVRESEVLVLIAPARPFGSGEMDAILDFVRGGGILILSTGYEEKDRSEALLGLFGARIQNVPLAHFETQAFGQKLRFAEAWPLTLERPESIPIAGHPGYPDPVMVFVPEGEGGALLIGDSQFLLNSNLESLEEWNVDNIMFLHTLFERLTSGGLGR